MSKTLISAKGIWKSYQLNSAVTEVLRGIDIDFSTRSLTAIVGASGAGKSTLLHILGSLDHATRGKVMFEGVDIQSQNDEKLSELRNTAIGFIFQFHHLLPEFSALENVMMPLWIRGEAKESVRQKAKILLEKLGLEGREEHRPPELSGGEQQRVAVARALIGSPKILFADEPTGNLDQENGEKLMELLLELYREHNMAVVMVTHNLEIAGRFRRIVELEDGCISRVTGEDS